MDEKFFYFDNSNMVSKLRLNSQNVSPMEPNAIKTMSSRIRRKLRPNSPIMGDSIRGNMNGYFVCGMSMYLNPWQVISDLPNIMYVALSQVGFQLALSRSK